MHVGREKMEHTEFTGGLLLTHLIIYLYAGGELIFIVVLVILVPIVIAIVLTVVCVMLKRNRKVYSDYVFMEEIT